MSLFKFLHQFSTKYSENLSFLKTDMHCHILPEIDDGAKTVEESVSLVSGLQSLGYTKLICTPHINEIYANNIEVIEAKYQVLRQRLIDNGIEISIEYAAEYQLGLHFNSIIEKNALLSINKNFVLIEMSYMMEASNIRDVIFSILMKGYQPVLAHPERYKYYHNRIEAIKQIIDAGCLLQLNLLSLIGYYGKGAMQMANYLLKEKMISFAGTDVHHMKHIYAIKELLKNKNIVENLKRAPFKNAEL